MEAPLDLDFHRELRKLREGWQCRVLKGAKGHDRAIIASILAHAFEGSILTIMQAAFPGFQKAKPPFLCSSGRVDKHGHIVADVWEKDDKISRNQVIYVSDIAYRDAMRQVADRLKLSDQDRIEFFTCVKRWLAADMRLDPTMDPMDPDAKHLTRH